MTVGLIQSGHAGSAVALGPDNQMVADAGVPVAIAKQHALADARRKFGPSVRIVASSDVTGYGAIAIARHPMVRVRSLALRWACGRLLRPIR